ncbi:unnamed protein product [Candida verbasci]|uniref:Serine/threonine-protein kinase BUR1 n=1 Tax=Candida verbasci TaxID=1227364 RepID=A0A9W4TUA6_9ASCO|nr:unnamed protein product [Candida verbasci]
MVFDRNNNNKNPNSVKSSEVLTSSTSSMISSPSSSKDLLQNNQSVNDFSSIQVSESESKPSRTVIILTLVSSISGFMFGYDTGYISSALVQIGTDLSNKILTSGEKELITSATSLGALLGAILGGVLANLIGRKKVLLGSNIIFIVGTIIQLVAKHVWTMIAGRFVLGWGVGIASLIAPLMLSELAPSKYRGRLIVTNVMFITGGQLVAYLINWGLTRVAHGWKVSVGLCMVPPAVQFVLFWFLPDTPRFYVMNGEFDRAKKVLKKIYNDPSDAFVDATIDEMITSNSQVPGKNPLYKAWESIKIIHKTPGNFRALILACGLQGIQQFTGFNSLMYFSATIFETIGFRNPTAVSIIVAATNFVFTGIALCIIDKVGRRKILLIGIPCMCIALIVCAIAFHFLNVDFSSGGEVISRGINGWGIVVIIGMILYVASYAIGIGNAAWVGVELFSDVNVRSIGAMYAASTNWAGSLVIASTFLTMLQNITPTGTFSFFAGLCFISFLFVFFLLPDTAGLELEETTEFLANGFNVRQANQISKQRKKNSKFTTLNRTTTHRNDHVYKQSHNNNQQQANHHQPRAQQQHVPAQQPALPSQREINEPETIKGPVREMNRLQDYEILEKLGQGTFGVVQKAKRRSTNEVVAIKQLINHSAKEGFPLTAMREITILKQLDHTNILRISEMIFEEGKNNANSEIYNRGSFYTVSPYMASDLVGLLENPKIKLQLNEMKCLTQQLLRGIQYIHEQNYLHRDIKAANILIDSNGILKIADFGLARLYHGTVPRKGMGPGGGERAYTSLVVTRWYRPPEILLGERKYTTAVDIWGIGCVFAELFTRKPILVGKSDAHQAQLIFELIGPPTDWGDAARLPNKADYSIGLSCKRTLEAKFDKIMPKLAINLLSGFLTLNPYKRLNALDALNHDFFKTDPLPLKPEELPKYEDCHEIDKEKFKKMKDIQHREKLMTDLKPPTEPRFENRSENRNNNDVNSKYGEEDYDYRDEEEPFYNDEQEFQSSKQAPPPPPQEQDSQLKDKPGSRGRHDVYRPQQQQHRQYNQYGRNNRNEDNQQHGRYNRNQDDDRYGKYNSRTQRDDQYQQYDKYSKSQDDDYHHREPWKDQREEFLEEQHSQARRPQSKDRSISRDSSHYRPRYQKDVNDKAPEIKRSEYYDDRRDSNVPRDQQPPPKSLPKIPPTPTGPKAHQTEPITSSSRIRSATEKDSIKSKYENYKPISTISPAMSSHNDISGSVTPKNLQSSATEKEALKKSNQSTITMVPPPSASNASSIASLPSKPRNFAREKSMSSEKREPIVMKVEDNDVKEIKITSKDKLSDLKDMGSGPPISQTMEQTTTSQDIITPKNSAERVSNDVKSSLKSSAYKPNKLQFDSIKNKIHAIPSGNIKPSLSPSPRSGSSTTHKPKVDSPLSKKVISISSGKKETTSRKRKRDNDDVGNESKRYQCKDEYGSNLTDAEEDDDFKGNDKEVLDKFLDQPGLKRSIIYRKFLNE